VPQLLFEDALTQPGKLAFIYSGNGAQWLGMGQKLLAESPRFAAALADLDERIRPLSGFSILAELCKDQQDSRFEDTTVAQPLLFAIQVAVTTLLRERGVEADAVAGHSAGEVAAAWAAGALSLDQAAALICARSGAQGATRGAGRMAAVGLSEADARELISAEHVAGVEISGVTVRATSRCPAIWAHCSAWEPFSPSVMFSFGCLNSTTPFTAARWIRSRAI